MSTYNGARHVPQQIESILPQLQGDDVLLIRDDGSSDATVARIEALHSPRIRLVRGENLGFALSFLWLLHHVEPGHALYLLADQDDVWFPDKIDRAMAWIGSRPGAHLYCSRLQLVDQDLQPIGLSPAFRQPPDFWNAVCENIATGCTVALNADALALVRRVPWPAFAARQIAYHDWWLYLVVSRFGQVHFDPLPSMAYRQHGSNSIGMGAGLNRYLTIWRAVRKVSWVAMLVRQLRFFVHTHEAWLTAEERRLLQRLSSGTPTRIAWHLITSRRLRRQVALERQLLRALVIRDWLLSRIP